MYANELYRKSLWSMCCKKYAEGGYRAAVCRDLVLTDLVQFRAPTILDIGCGRGLLGDAAIQRSIAERAAEYIGVEPDRDLELPQWITVQHRVPLEDAPIPPGSVDMAIAAMVLEHLAHPEPFFKAVHRTLREEGVFWGFTVDARHWFAKVSRGMEELRIKQLYLDVLHGRRGTKRYENYPVYYAANTPEQIRRLAAGFTSCEIMNMQQSGQLDFYFPKGMRWLGRLMSECPPLNAVPGILLVVRLQK